jgi:hypothetical protein
MVALVRDVDYDETPTVRRLRGQNHSDHDADHPPACSSHPGNNPCSNGLSLVYLFR